MEKNKSTFCFLAIGHCGAGKSALSKLLTGNQNIVSMNSTQSVTSSISYHKCLDQTAKRWGYSLNIIDTPGLDI